MAGESSTSVQFTHAFHSQQYRQQLNEGESLGAGSPTGSDLCLCCLVLVFSKYLMSSFLPFLVHVVQVELTHPRLNGQARHPNHGDDGSHHITRHLQLGFW